MNASETGKQPYIGRFAPSPTGPLHLGSLYTALASFLDARHHHGQWRLRIDDLDRFRILPEASDQILFILDKLGLYWDGPVYYQSQHIADYDAAIDRLYQNGMLYPCSCSRKKLAQSGSVYPGFCRKNTHTSQQPYALRIKTDAQPIHFIDRLQGKIQQCLPQTTGDFIVKRKDNIIAYQLAVVIDEQQQHITQVVRGLDLLDSTTRQLYIQQQLDLAQPEYMHIPLIVDSHGIKLSKQTQAEAVSAHNPGQTLWHLLQKLNQHPPSELKHASAQDVLDWAIPHWQVDKLKKIRAISNQID
ncbi:tRNA glutamyl-Q(34) synthetase GluQRS [methane-oxidizing endosymbiont of Gigantopelta aegis]|uniref:tRNA glutamyl-Q(34) synthetase GluQRS n=1 Tax=methane-oxidizing endosymbiont of Gigantopelta aegis TaxID=2794938 RepID=UPI0018DB10F4|nr:tRNA glutamyl-Q(34) synthetase GluQRS [methane-oxidizing endosymbiont of Gigantopelta aegis]